MSITTTPVASTPAATLTVALIGNPNTGKSTLFNALAGVRQRVGNYPGVTVEKKIGYATHAGQRLELIDLPGTYSLAPRSLDEMVAVDVLLGRQATSAPPDAVLCILDASNLERNLYLVSQVLELGLPTVLALNMTDVAKQKGVVIDAARLAEKLGVPVVEIQANRRRGLDALKDALATVATRAAAVSPQVFPAAFQQEVTQLERRLNAVPAIAAHPLPRYLVERLLLDSGGYLENTLLRGTSAELGQELVAARQRLGAQGFPVPAVEAMVRYDWIESLLDGILTRPTQRTINWSDRIDRVLTHRIMGSIVFILVMIMIFQAVYVGADPLVGVLETIQGTVAEFVTARMSEGALRSLLVDGLIGGVGGVITFLPQILILFLFISVLEDCGYMARAAYLMDKLMSRVGLSGKSFIPLLSSFACAIPGVMATRVIENRRDRLTTILIAPLMSCSARLPVYTLLIAAFIPNRTYLGGLLGLQGLTMLAMYFLGAIAAVVVAWILKKTLLQGPTPPFVMELPGYKWPSIVTVVHRVFSQGWAFVYRAGTLIVAVSVVVWAASYYPRDPSIEAAHAPRVAQLEAELESLPEDSDQAVAASNELTEIDNVIRGAHQRNSYLGRAGHWIEPAVRPLGWDWRLGCAAIASFPAREVVVATLGIIYNLGDDIDPSDPENENSRRLQETLQNATWDGTDRPVFTIPVALGLMVFFALCAQCAATLVVIKRETGNWFWPIFTFVYMTTLAYLGALVTYQVGTWIGS